MGNFYSDLNVLSNLQRYVIGTSLRTYLIFGYLELILTVSTGQIILNSQTDSCVYIPSSNMQGCIIGTVKILNFANTCIREASFG